MAKFPVDTPINKVVKTFEELGVRRRIKGSTLRTILTQSGISRDDFLNVYEKQ